MSDRKDIWVIAEHWEGKIRPVTRELVALARSLADASGGRSVVLVLGENARELAGELGGLGIDAAVCVSSPELKDYRARPWAEAAGAVLRKNEPAAVLMSASTDGRELAASLAAHLDVGIAPDCTEVEWTEGRLQARRPSPRPACRCHPRHHPDLRKALRPEMSEWCRPALVRKGRQPRLQRSRRRERRIRRSSPRPPSCESKARSRCRALAATAGPRRREQSPVSPSAPI